ncbi:MAG: GDP-mannose 4,6-dehydratase [Alphaproteobacteria bacterium]|nr:GDP-mannose 4,6-dehydratase [Alphaproteobacteria bacterium]
MGSMSTMRVLITGARGFVGPYLMEALRRACGGDVAVIATSKEGGTHPVFGQTEALDVTNETAVGAIIARHQPTHVIHLAAVASRSAALADPKNAWRVHVQGALNMAHAILDEAPDCRLLHVGSGLVYGESAKSGLPLDETALLAPVDDYAVTKAAADLALGALARRGLKVLRMRPFNHTGPGQEEAFVVPAFAMQIARIEAGLLPPVIRVGNLDAERDFLDVRDVARAYALAMRNADDLEPGAILNIASGLSRRIGDILDHLLRLARVKITVQTDPARLRPSDLPCIIGDASRARMRLGWALEYPFEETLAAMLDDCRARVASKNVSASC